MLAAANLKPTSRHFFFASASSLVQSVVQVGARLSTPREVYKVIPHNKLQFTTIKKGQLTKHMLFEGSKGIWRWSTGVLSLARQTVGWGRTVRPFSSRCLKSFFQLVSSGRPAAAYADNGRHNCQGVDVCRVVIPLKEAGATRVDAKERLA